MKEMRIVIGSDHAGFELKEHIKQFLEYKKINYEDGGTTSSNSVDYPDIAVKISNNYLDNHFDYGILVCGSGIGMSIVANKIKRIRAALCNTVEMAKLARLHNNANILCLGGRIVSFKEAEHIIATFLSTEFSSEERHHQRVNKIHELTGV